MDSIKKPPHETLGTPCPQITPNAHSYTENSSCLTHTHTTLWLASCVCSSMAVRANFGRWLVSIHRKPDGICRPKRNHELALSHRLWESKREALASGLVCCRIKKRDASVRILPQEEAESVEHIHRRQEKASKSVAKQNL